MHHTRWQVTALTAANFERDAATVRASTAYGKGQVANMEEQRRRDEASAQQESHIKALLQENASVRQFSFP